MDIITLLFVHGQSFKIEFYNKKILGDFLESLSHGQVESADEILIRNDIEVQFSIKTFIENYREVDIINRFYEFLKQLEKLPNDILFFVLPISLDYDTNKLINYFSKLSSIHKQRGIQTPTNIFEVSKWQEIFNTYNLLAIGHKRRVIGKKGICRFCKTSEGEYNIFGSLVSFKNKAHTICEALGNKKVTSRDECDACNERFSKDIEPSLVNFLKIFRTIYGIRGKNGETQLKGKAFTLTKDNISIKYNGILSSVTDLNELTQVLHLNPNDCFIPLNVYKCLVKFILGVLPIQDLKYFDETLSWINGSKKSKELPSIINYELNNIYYEPILLVFTKKVDDFMDLPYIFAEFRFANQGFIFTVPYCEKDSVYISFEKVCNLYSMSISEIDKQQWSSLDFTSEETIKIGIDFKINNINIGVNTFIDESNITHPNSLPTL